MGGARNSGFPGLRGCGSECFRGSLGAGREVLSLWAFDFARFVWVWGYCYIGFWILGMTGMCRPYD